VMFKLALPALALLAVVALAVAAWRVTGRAWAGPVAAALMFAVGELVVPRYAVWSFGSIVQYYGWSSRSIVYSVALTGPLIVLAVDKLRGGQRGWALIAVFAFAAAGAKSTVLPVALAGAVLAGLARPRNPRPWALAGVFVAAQVLAVAVLYRFESQGLTISPFTVLLNFVGTQQEAPRPEDWKLVLFGLGAYGIALGTRLAGIAFVRRWTEAEWFLLGGLLGGAGATLLIWHVSWSQHFFLVAGFPFGAILSAAGVVALAERTCLKARAAAAVVALAVAAAIPFTVWRLDLTTGRLPRQYLVPLPTVLLGLAVLGIALLAGLVFLRAGRHAALLVALCVVLAAGLGRLPWDARYNANLGTAYHVQVTPEQATAARWLRANSSPDDLVATNVHRTAPGDPGAQSLSYWISAFSERRVLLGSWGYSIGSLRRQVAARQFGPSHEYWDPAALAANDAAIRDGEVGWLRRQGVDWILVDRRYFAESPRLREVADLRWERGDTAVYRLPSL